MKARKGGMKKRSMKKSMKAMRKRKAMKISKIAKGKRARVSVWNNPKKDKTSGGLRKSDLKKNKAGKIVSRAASDAAKKGKSYKKIMAWNRAVKAARKQLGIKGFCPVRGKTAKGQKLYKLVKSIYKK